MGTLEAFALENWIRTARGANSAFWFNFLTICSFYCNKTLFFYACKVISGDNSGNNVCSNVRNVCLHRNVCKNKKHVK